MGTWEDYLTARYDRYMMLSARLQGVIEAHKILKGGSGDFADELLWNMTVDIIRGADGE